MSRKDRRDRQRARRALDYRAMMSLKGDVLDVRAYASNAALAAGTVASPQEGADGLVVLYDLICLAPLPASSTQAVPNITTRFDISGSDYPVTPPMAIVVSQHKPFCTHVQPLTGFVCIGSLWGELKGKELLAEFGLRLVAAYNFQDPPTDELGFQPGALLYHRVGLEGRAFNPELQLPAIPESVFAIPKAATPRAKVVVVSTPRTPALAVPVRSSTRRVVIVGGGPS